MAVAAALFVLAQAQSYIVADYRSSYTPANFVGQTRAQRQNDGWDYGSVTTPGTTFYSLPWTAGHPCFGTAYGTGACLFVNGTTIRPDANTNQVAIKYTFQQSWNTVNLAGTVTRPETCGDGNCLKIILFNGVSFVQMLSTNVGLGATVPFNIQLNSVQQGWYVLIVSCALATTPGDYLNVQATLSANCADACYNFYCTPSFQGSCELGDTCTNSTVPPTNTSICARTHHTCSHSESECVALDALCESSGMSSACSLAQLCYNVVNECVALANHCDEEAQECPGLVL